MAEEERCFRRKRSHGWRKTSRIIETCRSAGMARVENFLEARYTVKGSGKLSRREKSKESLEKRSESENNIRMVFQEGSAYASGTVLAANSGGRMEFL